MSEKREKVMQAAEKLVARGKLSQAIKEYRKLLRENPNDANTLNRVGDLYARQDKVDEAVALFEKIAQTYSRDGFFVKAIAIYKKIIRLDPTQLDVYERLAELYHRQGLVSEARSQYQVLADYYRNHGDNAARIEIHRKMADLEPSDPSPRVKLAELYLAEGLIEETIGEYQRIAEVMLDHSRVEEATKVYLRALDVDSEDLAFISEAVLRLREDGHHEAATKVFEAAIALNPEAAKLAERMREHAAEKEPAAEPEVEEVVEAGDSVDVAEVLGEAAAEPPGEISPEELEEIQVSSDIAGGTETTADGAFVIDIDEEVAGDEEVEIDLGELEEVAGEQAPPSSAADPVASIDELAASLGLEPGAPAEKAPTPPAESAPPASEAAAEAVPVPEADAEATRLAELLAEAEVFGKYGLETKALRRFEEALELEPTHLETHRRLVAFHLDRGSEAEVVESAQRMIDQAETGSGQRWEQILARLTRAGYVIEKGEVSRVATAKAPATLETPSEVAAEEEGLEWLEDLSREGESKELFEVEEEFFDLAAEIEKELAAEGALGDAEEITDATPSGDESLEEIVEGFKKGVSEVLSPEAYDTHYNLGIAYREMGLVDEAIGEFQLSAKDPGHLVDSCSMLGGCFLEKGFPDLAIKWYKRGLEASGISEDESLGLMYDMGSVHALSGEREAAYEIFVEIYGINSHYRDVVARLEELRGG